MEALFEDPPLKSNRSGLKNGVVVGQGFVPIRKDRFEKKKSGVKGRPVFNQGAHLTADLIKMVIVATPNGRSHIGYCGIPFYEILFPTLM